MLVDFLSWLKPPAAEYRDRHRRSATSGVRYANVILGVDGQPATCLSILGLVGLISSDWMQTTEDAPAC